MPASHDENARTDAVRALENEFSVIARRYREVVATLAHRLSEGMLPGTYRVLTTIARHGPVTASALAEELAADKAFISRAVRELESLGLIQREPDPQDGRAFLLSTTPDGAARLETVRTGYNGQMARTLATWELADIRRLTHLLRSLAAGTTPEHDGATL